MHVDAQSVEGALYIVAVNLKQEIAFDETQGRFGCKMELFFSAMSFRLLASRGSILRPVLSRANLLSTIIQYAHIA